MAGVLDAILEDELKRSWEEAWAKAGPLKLGRVWKVNEEVRDAQGRWNGESWEGTWTRISGTRAFDAVWQNNKSHQELRDTVIVDFAERGKVAAHRVSATITYVGTYHLDHPETILGEVKTHHDGSWRVTIIY